MEWDLLFGKIALKRGWITNDQLREAITLQQKETRVGPRKPLGELLRDRGYLTDSQIADILKAQRVISFRVDEIRYGRLAVRNGFVTEEAVQEALARQREELKAGRKRRIGQLLIDRGRLTRRQHEAVLKIQARLRASSSAPREFIKFSCPECQRRIGVSREQRGKTHNCPLCGLSLTVPEESHF